MRSHLRSHKKSLERRTLLCLGCALLLVGASAFSGRAADNPQGQAENIPKVEFKDIEWKGIDLANQKAEAIFSVVIQNPGLAFRLQDLRYKLKLNEVEVAEGKYDKAVEVAAAAETVVGLPITFDITKIPGVVWNTLTDSLTLRYELDTEFTVPLFGSLRHTQKSSFKGDFPVGEALTALPGKLKEKLFGKP